MKALIIEDEQIASRRLTNQINELGFDIEIVDTLDSVESGKSWFLQNEAPDLVFLDIQLNDGYGFDILEALEKQPPVIFTTAYNEYAVRGFKYNGVDYLLKPIDKKELKTALEKFMERPVIQQDHSTANIAQFKNIFKKEYKHRFMVKVGNHFSTFNVADVAYFYASDGSICLRSFNGKTFPIEYTIDQLEELLNPIDFFRVNRKFLISLTSVEEIHNYFNSRLLLRLEPDVLEKVIVSRERCTSFKKWLDM
ncbi:response regulator transcription factor [Aquimarina sp. U1-2]|uniref:LytR/AlgR family response regulator transcription factor n=1 Tax=Aquimarina sp. U1-2 TaxID=2823141 RepID=UPI001AECF43C|nr:LytTR family DNA-binding domain-containing protein [Aquimarina sp. U1-2]MBP2831515.1 response regulator transcription factor [Aquimarina sp. U1-2]